RLSGRRGIEFVEKRVQDVTRLGPEFWERGSGTVVDYCGDGGKDLADCEGGDVAVCYDYPGRRGGEGVRVQVFGKGGGQMAFAAVAVETDAERLGELEAPLRERARMKGVEEGVGGVVGVFVGVDSLMVLFVGEEGEGGEGIVGGFGIAGTVLKKVLALLRRAERSALRMMGIPPASVPLYTAFDWVSNNFFAFCEERGVSWNRECAPKMKFPSSSRSFALLALSLLICQLTLGLSIDVKTGKLQPRLDRSLGLDFTLSTSASSGPTYRRGKKCSGTGTGVVSAPYATGSGYNPPFQNGTALSSSLPYPQSSYPVGELPSTASFASSGTSGDANSPVSATLASACGQATTTVTNEYTVTVTVSSDNSPMSSNIADASATGSASPLSNVTASSGPSDINGSASTTAPTWSLPSGSSSSSLTERGAGSNLPISSQAASGSVPISSTVDATSASAATSDAPQTPSINSPASMSSTSSTSTSTASHSTIQTSDIPYNHDGEFWAGADIDTIPRMLALPGRTVYDFDGKTVKDPIQILADAGLNAFRVETWRGDCLGEKPFINNATVLGDERNFRLDFGCIGTKVKIAQQAVGLGMKMQLTINQGFNIPKGMEKYNYEKMIDEVQRETKRQLQPFLDARIVPDIILFENEGTDGFLFHEEATGHDRGVDDGKVSQDVVNQEKCGQIPTGKMNSYPQWAGYNKAEVTACNEAIQAAGFSTDAVRYGIHSHGQYVQWKESVVHGADRPSQTNLTKLDGTPCEGPNPIPANILAIDAAEVLTIAGFSAYPDPMRPADINSDSSIEATFDRLKKTLTQLQGYAEEYGKYTSGPFKGQYKLQGLGVEYATQFKYPDEIPQQQRHTEMMWAMVKQFSATFIGMLWWEPWYCNNNWEGGQATLCHLIPGQGQMLGEAPTDTLKTWGSAAVSPWKNT
ncbi:MAG: hypothetical protein Q9181_001991, partial [Wetmoreana brouardii]